MHLRDFRQKHKIPQKDIAAVVDVDVATICKYESFTIKPSLRVLCILHRITKGVVTSNDFLTLMEREKINKIKPLV